MDLTDPLPHNLLRSVILLLCEEISSQPAITCSKLIIETLGQGVKYVFIVNFEHISHIALVFLLLVFLFYYH